MAGQRTSTRRLRRRTLAACLALLSLGALGGCNLVGVLGVMAESYKRSSTHLVHRDYDGLEGKSFAVFVTVDRSVASSHPQLQPQLTAQISARLVEHAGASGFVPPVALLDYQYRNPAWVTKSYERIATDLGVERLIWVDIYEYRLNEPGNAYLWEGVAAASVGVIEADSGLVEDFMYQKELNVGFPDDKGYGPVDLDERLVQAELNRRFVDRVTWLFYDHQEPYYPDY